MNPLFMAVMQLLVDAKLDDVVTLLRTFRSEVTLGELSQIIVDYKQEIARHRFDIRLYKSPHSEHNGIQNIKFIREFTGWGLRESKDAWDNLVLHNYVGIRLDLDKQYAEEQFKIMQQYIRDKCSNVTIDVRVEKYEVSKQVPFDDNYVEGYDGP